MAVKKNISCERALEAIFFNLENLMLDENFEDKDEGKMFLARANATSELISQYTSIERAKTERINAASGIMKAASETGINISEVPLLMGDQ